MEPSALGSKRSKIASKDLKDGISDALNRVEYAGERIIVTRHGRPSAVLVQVSEADLAAFHQLAESSAA